MEPTPTNEANRRVLHVVGARPNFMKAASVMRAVRDLEHVDQVLVHTGQHYDAALSDTFFEDLELPRPDVNLGVGSASHAVQTAQVMIEFEPVLDEFAPDWVFVVGDVNSTVAATLVAAKKGVPVAHVEAGLRSFDRSMPEEINRVLTDRICQALFTTEESANRHLRDEGIAPEKIHFVGNVMIDVLDRFRERAARLDMPSALGLPPGEYLVATLHRPGNVDDPEHLSDLMAALAAVTERCEMPLVFPMHPRTRSRIESAGLSRQLEAIRVVEPLGYLEFIGLMDASAAVITDSGGIQEETTVLGIPCVTLRPNTERPVTLEHGTNRLYDGPLEGLSEVVESAVAEERRPSRPPLWDGKAGERIATVLRDQLLPSGGEDRQPREEHVSEAGGPG